MKKWGFVALLLVGATILGSTVLHEPIANAAQNVGATIVGPLDANGNVKVAQQGTANVNVTNGRRADGPDAGNGRRGPAHPSRRGRGDDRPDRQRTHARVPRRRFAVILSYQGATVAWVIGSVASATSGPETVPVALTRPIKFDEIFCGGGGNTPAARCLVSGSAPNPDPRVRRRRRRASRLAAANPFSRLETETRPLRMSQRRVESASSARAAPSIRRTSATARGVSARSSPRSMLARTARSWRAASSATCSASSVGSPRPNGGRAQVSRWWLETDRAKKKRLASEQDSGTSSGTSS